MRPRRRRRRFGITLPVLVIFGFLVATAGSAAGFEGRLHVVLARASGGNVDLVKLRQQAEEARTEVRKATQSYQDGKERLSEARERLERMRRELKRTRRKLDKLRQPVAEIANASYQHSPVTGFGSVFTSERPQHTMRAAVDFAKLAREQRETLREMSELVGQRKRLVKSSENLTKTAAATADELKQKRKKLKRMSQRETKQLVTAMQGIGLDVSRDERLPIDCNPADGASAEAYPNGLIPESALCPLPQDGESLRADAAVAFGKLNAAYADHFGKPICVTDSYRSLGSQQTLYVTKPGLAAVPGTSNHGRGMAVDLCGGVNAFGSAEFIWMKDNASDYGFVHPEWAQATGSRPEPWHWEYYKAES